MKEQHNSKLFPLNSEKQIFNFILHYKASCYDKIQFLVQTAASFFHSRFN